MQGFAGCVSYLLHVCVCSRRVLYFFSSQIVQMLGKHPNSKLEAANFRTAVNILNDSVHHHLLQGIEPSNQMTPILTVHGMLQTGSVGHWFCHKTREPPLAPNVLGACLDSLTTLSGSRRRNQRPSSSFAHQLCANELARK